MEGQQLFLDALHVQQLCVVGVELGQRIAILVAVLEVFIVVEIPLVAGDTVEVAHIGGVGALLVGEQRLVQLLAVANADDPNLGIGSKQLADRLRQRFDGASRCFLHQNIAGGTVLEGEEHQIHRLFQRHDEAGHLRFGNGDGTARLDLIDPQRDDRSAAAHNVAVTGTADGRLLGRNGTGLCHHNLLHHSLGGAHRIDRISRLVGRQADHPLNARLDSGSQHVVGSQHIGLHRFHGEELAGRHLLECRRMEDVIHAVHSVLHRLQIPHVADVKFDFSRHLRHFHLKFVAHIVLLFLIPREDANLPNVGGKEAVQNGIAEGPGPARDEQGFVCELVHG